MDDVARILLTRGAELCAEWDKHNDVINSAREKWDRRYHDEKRVDAGIRLDELCLLANLFEIASYDDFRERIQKSYEHSRETED